MAKKPKLYNITPAKGQAILNFSGRRFPEKIELFENKIIEKIRNKNYQNNIELDTEKKVNTELSNKLIQGDCLSACAYLKAQKIKVDLVYIDPPFASGANYAKNIYLRNNNKNQLDNEDNSLGEEILYGDIWQKEDYLNWIYERLIAIRDIMSESALIFVHLDWHIGHYVKILLDEVFGEENFVNELIWHYHSGSGSRGKYFSKKHNNIYLYSKSFNDFYFDDSKVRVAYDEKTKQRHLSGYKGHIKNPDWQPNPFGKMMDDVLDIDTIAPTSPELQNYTTQKPIELIKKIIETATDENWVVADFFVGSGTTAVASNVLNRKFIVCDISLNSIQTTRDRLVKEKAEFDIIKINDGLRLFRNPAQTQQKIYSLIEGFKSRTELGLGDFWDGGIASSKGHYVPVKMVGIQEKLTKELLDFYLEQIYQLESEDAVEAVKIIYAHKDIDIDQSYVNKEIRDSKRTTLKVELKSLDELLGEKRDLLFPQDNAEVKVTKQKDYYKVEIKKYFSSYLKHKIDDYNAKKVQKKSQEEAFDEKQNKNKIKLSNNGLELIEAVQFDTTLREDDVWESNLELEDKAGIKEKIKGKYYVKTPDFNIKIRNIAGDEIIINIRNGKIMDS